MITTADRLGADMIMVFGPRKGRIAMITVVEASA